MRSVEVDVSRIALLTWLDEEVQHCKLCRTARLCFSFCCPEHYRKIKKWVVETEAIGGRVEMHSSQVRVTKP